MELNKHKFIILASYSSNALGQIRSLGWKGILPIVVLAHPSTYRIDKSKYIAELYHCKDFNEGLDFILNKFGNEQYKPFLFADCEEVIGLLDKRYYEFYNKFYFWNGGEQGRITHFINKENQIRLAESCGMKVPKSEVVRVGEMPKTLSFPIFTKSVDSLSIFWKGNEFICNNEEELKAAYAKMDVEQILLQEFIIKQEETPIEGISINNGQDVLLTVKSVNYRMTKESHGIYRHVEPFIDTELAEKIKKFVKAIHYNGIFGIEFIINKEGIPYFLEINLRITQYNSAYAMFGANLPYIYAQSVLSGKIAEEDNIRYTTKRPFIVMSEFEDLKFSCLHGNVSLWQWLMDVKRTDCFQYYDKNDNRPFYFTLYSKLILAIKKILWKR